MILLGKRQPRNVGYCYRIPESGRSVILSNPDIPGIGI